MAAQRTPRPAEMGERLLTARVVAERLGLCTETVLAWVREGKLPAFRLPGGAIRFRETDLEAWLQARATSRLGASATTPEAAGGVTLHRFRSTPIKDEEHSNGTRNAR